jgi:hypothetical protein
MGNCLQQTQELGEQMLDSCRRPQNEVINTETNILEEKKNLMNERLELEKKNSDTQITNLYDNNIQYQIYKGINDIRLNPENYFSEYNDNDNIKETFENFVSSNQRPKQLKYNEEDSNKINDYLKDKKNNDKSTDDKKNDIYNLLNINDENSKFIQTMGDNDNVKSSIWNFFDSCDEDLNDVLFNNYDFIIISSVPLNNSKTIITIILYNK